MGVGLEEHKFTSQNSTLPQVDYFITSRAPDSFKERIEWMVEFQTHGSGGGVKKWIQNLLPESNCRNYLSLGVPESRV